MDPSSPVPHATRPHSPHSSHSAWGLNALSLIFFRAFAFSPQLTLTSCFKMSDSFVLFGSQFLRQTGSDHPFQDSPLPRHCPPSLPVGWMLLLIDSFTSCLPSSLGYKVHGRRDLACLVVLSWYLAEYSSTQ